MKTLIVTCPECSEDLEIPQSDWLEFSEGDVLVCDSCDTELLVTSLEPPEFEVLGDLSICPKCDAEFDLTETDLEHHRATCPSCGFAFTLEF